MPQRIDSVTDSSELSPVKPVSHWYWLVAVQAHLNHGSYRISRHVRAAPSRRGSPRCGRSRLERRQARRWTVIKTYNRLRWTTSSNNHAGQSS
jgi:hypothetical protein